MKYRSSILALLLATLFPVQDAPADAPPVPGKVLVTTLEWPPYTGDSIPAGGAVTEAVRQAFGNAGVETEIMFLPWKRAIAYAKDATDGAVGFFPGYHCDQRPDLIASRPIGTGPLVLAERADADVS